MVREPPAGPEVVRGPSCRSGSGRGTRPEVRKWSVDLPEGSEVVEDPPQVQKWSGDPPEVPEVVGGPTRRSGSGRGTYTVVQKWSEG